MPVNIYFCGEAVADLLEDKQNSGNFELLLGGSLFNGAIGAKRVTDRENLGFRIGFISPLSNDMLGQRFFKILQDMNIDTQGVARVDRNTTLAIVSVHPGVENAFVIYSRAGVDEMTNLEELPKNLGVDDDSKIFCFGSISSIMEPARFAWLEFARRQRANSLVFYDLNARPSIARDPEAYRAIILEWAGIAHIMKASDADIGWAYPGKAIREVADIWLDAGAHMAVFTKGPQGSEAYTRKVSAIADSCDCNPVHTIGAGDNFNAGFVLNLAKTNHLKPQNILEVTQQDLIDALKEANDTAARHLVSSGSMKKPCAA